MEARKPFIYLAIIAGILGIIGILMMQQNFSGRVVLSDDDKAIKAENIMKHNSQGDCWISINSIVYDATFVINNYDEFKDFAGNCGANADSAAKNMDAGILKFLDDYRLGILT